METLDTSTILFGLNRERYSSGLSLLYECGDMAPNYPVPAIPNAYPEFPYDYWNADDKRNADTYHKAAWDCGI